MAFCFGLVLVVLGVLALPAHLAGQLSRVTIVSLGAAPVAASPLEQFKTVPFVSLSGDSVNLPFTVAGLYSVLAVAVLVVFFCFVRVTLVPSRAGVASESFYMTLLTLVRQQVGTSAEFVFPFVAALFAFVLVLNLLGNVPYGFTVTSSLAVTLGLSVSIWFFTLFLGVSNNGLHFLAHFVPGGTPLVLVPLLVLIETVSYSARALSLGVRLFSNMLAGHTLLAILSGFLYKLVLSSVGVALICILPFALFVALVGLELAVSFIQAYVLVVLVSSYIRDGLPA